MRFWLSLVVSCTVCTAHKWLKVGEIYCSLSAILHCIIHFIFHRIYYGWHNELYDTQLKFTTVISIWLLCVTVINAFLSIKCVEMNMHNMFRIPPVFFFTPIECFRIYYTYVQYSTVQCTLYSILYILRNSRLTPAKPRLQLAPPPLFLFQFDYTIEVQVLVQDLIPIIEVLLYKVKKIIISSSYLKI